MEEKKKENLLVSYNNELNRINFSGLTSEELNFFIALCALVRDKGAEPVSIHFPEFRKIAHLKNFNSKDQIYSKVDTLFKKTLEMTGRYEDDEVLERFTLFSDLIYRKKDSSLHVQVNPTRAYILNEIGKFFTSFELEEFIKLKSKHAKNLYRLLKQFDNKNSGYAIFKIEDFEHRMGVKEYYRGNEKALMAEVITPAITELEPIFTDLKVETDTLKEPGSPVVGYKFTWHPSKNNQIKMMDIDSSIPEEDKKVVTKIANDIYNGKKSSNSANKGPWQNYMKHNYDYDSMEKILLELD